MKEVISRVLSIFMFPIAFILRDRIRIHLYSINEVLVKERTFEDTLYYPLRDFYRQVNWFYFILWMFLDDSTARDSFHKDGSIMYDASDSDEHYPKWVLDTNWFWLRATWWSFIRNNTVNYVSWTKTSGWIEPTQYTCYIGKYDAKIDKSDNNSYFVKGMYLINVLHKDGNYYPRFTYVGEALGYKIAIWMGKSKSSGRFSFSWRIKK
jgi:hypothetical protein